MQIIDYDDLAAWEPLVSAAMSEIMPAGLIERLQSLKPEFFEDAGELVLESIDQTTLVQHLNSKLSPFLVRVYHGTRLTESEVESIKVEGLRPLSLAARRSALVSIFKQHERWSEVESQLDRVLHDMGPGNQAGLREDACVHVCFSRAGLVHGCNHYLTHGAEVDGHVADALFGDDSADVLLQGNRHAKLITFLAPFPDAARAANPFGFHGTDLPSLLGILFRAWAHHAAAPTFTVASLKNCTAARFPSAIPAHRIEAIQDVSDVELGIE